MNHGIVRLFTREQIDIDSLDQMLGSLSVAAACAPTSAVATATATSAVATNKIADSPREEDDTLGENIADSDDDRIDTVDSNDEGSNASSFYYKIGIPEDEDDGYREYQFYKIKPLLDGEYEKDVSIGYKESLMENLTDNMVEIISAIDQIIYLSLITKIPLYGFDQLEQLVLKSCEFNTSISYIPPNVKFLDLFGLIYVGPEHHNCETIAVSNVDYFDFTKFPTVTRLLMNDINNYCVAGDNKVSFLSANYVPVIDLSYFPNIEEINIAKYEICASKHITIVYNLPRHEFTFQFNVEKFPRQIIVNDLWWNTELLERIECYECD
jgi:hypothetical protein